ncbi:MAG: 4'-phosphopantetheinyl transferase superfamily protein [Candidatus Hydrogenedentes bacterium]|nr:4'-phosphopantetheinyl transferase superfamily protein [Candidatus Hydrogenedentota bacterium]
MAESVWESPSTLPSLGEGQVNVLRFSLEYLDTESARFLDVLDTDERMRAARFKRAIHQERFAVGRALLRTILAFYTKRTPASIKFSYGTHGKPTLDSFDSPRSLQFNLSHSGGEAVCAVSRGRPVGVDIEAMKARVAIEAIADRFFAPEESSHLTTCNDEERIPAFYQIWTAKEALLKGAGGGLTIPLDRCCFDLEPQPLGLTLVDLPALEAAQWRVYRLPPLDGFSGAVAISGAGTAPRYYRCDFLPRCLPR